MSVVPLNLIFIFVTQLTVTDKDQNFPSQLMHFICHTLLCKTAEPGILREQEKKK